MSNNNTSAWTPFPGRLARKPYWIRYLVLYFASKTASKIIDLGLDRALSDVNATEASIKNASSAAIFASLVLTIIISVITANILARRVHDYGKSAKIPLLLVAVSAIIPILFVFTGGFLPTEGSEIADYLANPQLWLLVVYIGVSVAILVLGAFSGTVGPNRYGPAPLVTEAPQPA